MTAAAMLSIAMLTAMMIAGHRRVIAELSCQQSSHSLITAALDPAVQFDARIGQCLLGTAADAAANERIDASTPQQARQSAMSLTIRTDYLTGRHLISLAHINLKSLRLSKMLKNIAICIGNRNFHIYRLLLSQMSN